MKDTCPEVLDELDLPCRVACCSGHGEHSHLLGTILKTQSSGEHTVASRVLEDILRTATHHPQTAGYGIGPFVKVLLCVEYHGRVACGTAGRVQSHTVFQGHTADAERIVLAQVFLGGEG